MFYGWTAAPVTTIVTICPFSITAPLDATIAQALAGLAIGIMTGTLSGGVGHRRCWLRRSSR